MKFRPNAPIIPVLPRRYKLSIDIISGCRLNIDTVVGWFMAVNTMETLSARTAQKTLAKVIGRVSKTDNPVIVTAKKGKHRVVFISYKTFKNWNSMNNTVRLAVPYSESDLKKLTALPKTFRDIPCAEDDELYVQAPIGTVHLK